jgi:hypothetical protein
VKTSALFRRWLAGWLVLTLLFAQGATAAYACPMWQPGGPAQAMPDCAEMAGGTAMDTAQPNLCKAHCDADKQSLNPAAHFDFAAGVVLLGSVAWWPGPAPSKAWFSLRHGARRGAPPGSPPLYLALQVFRI